jgi:hypothetical protein
MPYYPELYHGQAPSRWDNAKGCAVPVIVNTTFFEKRVDRIFDAGFGRARE